jgi:hypothetical protein
MITADIGIIILGMFILVPIGITITLFMLGANT